MTLSPNVSKKDSESQVFTTEEMNQIQQHPHMSYNGKNNYHMNSAINLQLSQPEQQNDETSTRNMKLWYLNTPTNYVVVFSSSEFH